MSTDLINKTKTIFFRLSLWYQEFDWFWSIIQLNEKSTVRMIFFIIIIFYLVEMQIAKQFFFIYANKKDIINTCSSPSPHIYIPNTEFSSQQFNNPLPAQFSSPQTSSYNNRNSKIKKNSYLYIVYSTIFFFFIFIYYKTLLHLSPLYRRIFLIYFFFWNRIHTK